MDNINLNFVNRVVSLVAVSVVSILCLMKFIFNYDISNISLLMCIFLSFASFFLMFYTIKVLNKDNSEG